MTDTVPAPEPTRAAPGPASAEPSDVHELRLTWARTADDFDEIAVAQQLYASVPGDLHPSTGVNRARLLLVDGRPEAALALLPVTDRDRLVQRPPTEWADVVALACWAATGDEAALAALVRAGAGMTGRAAETHAYLLGSAAEQCGRYVDADQAWRAATASSRTVFGLSRLVVAQVAGRDTDSVDAAVASVVDAAQALLLDPSPDEDMVRTRTVVDLLLARGDRAGATLLLEALVRLRPRDARLAALRDQHAVRRRRLRERTPLAIGVAVSALVVALTVVLHLPPFTALAGLSAAAWGYRHRLATTSLGTVDDVVLQGLGSLAPEAPSATTVWTRLPRPALWTLFVLAGLCVSTVVGVLLLMLVLPETASDDVISLAMLVLVTVGTAVCAVAMHRVRRRTLARLAERERVAERARMTAATRSGPCSCSQRASAYGAFADAYADGHLRPADPAVAGTTLTGFASVDVLECPLSGLRWLATRSSPDAATVLLRGTARSGPEEPVAQGTGGYL